MSDTPPEQLASIKDDIDLTQEEVLDLALDLLIDLGYSLSNRTPASIFVERGRPALFARKPNLVVIAQTLPHRGVKVRIEGTDREGIADHRSSWSAWADSLPKVTRNEAYVSSGAASEDVGAGVGDSAIHTSSDVETLRTSELDGSPLQKISSLTSQLNLAIQSRDTAGLRIKTLEREIAAKKQANADLEHHCRQLEEKVSALQKIGAENSTLEKKIATLEQKVKTTNLKHEKLMASMATERDKAVEQAGLLEAELKDRDSLETDLKKIHTKLNSLKSAEQKRAKELTDYVENMLSTTLARVTDNFERTSLAHLEKLSKSTDASEDLREIKSELKTLHIIRHKLELGSTTLYALENREDWGESEAEGTSVTEVLLGSGQKEFLFRSPFELDSEEVKLLKLVAASDEVTVSQLKAETNRRRAADDLDDLLDRLIRDGFEPIVKEEDRYFFDPDFIGET